MAITQADLDDMDRRIATAKQRVESGDKAITEFNIAQLVQARQHMASVIAAAANPGGVRTMRSIARFSRS
jgi:hypothetical protein